MRQKQLELYDSGLLNVLDWMEDDALPLVRDYLGAHPDQAKGILAKIAQDHDIVVER